MRPLLTPAADKEDRKATNPSHSFRIGAPTPAAAATLPV